MEIIDYNPQKLLEALQQRDVRKLREIFENYNLVDIAETLNELNNPKEILFVFKTVPPALTAEVFTYLDSEVQESLVKALSTNQIGDILDNIYTDDIVDFLEEMPSNLMMKILRSVDKETRREVNQLLNYAENSAGSLMTTEFVELKPNDTKEQAIAKVKKQGREAETISYLFVVDKTRELVGALGLKDLLFADENQTIEDIMVTDIVSVITTEDQEDVAQKFKKYDLNALPVVTHDNRLVGIITVDDILDVIEEEMTEDVQKTAAMTPLDDEYLKTSPLKVAANRIVWLVILLASSTFTGLIINSFEEALVIIPALTIFIPMIMGTGGNSGGQASTTVIRGIALGEFDNSNYFKVIGHEILVALITGFTLGVFAFGWIMLESVLHIISFDSSVSPVMIAFLVGVTILITVLLAKVIGAVLPILAKKVGLDPALMAQPLVTTIVDVLSLMVYFTLITQVFNLI